MRIRKPESDIILKAAKVTQFVGRSFLIPLSMVEYRALNVQTVRGVFQKIDNVFHKIAFENHNSHTV